MSLSPSIDWVINLILGKDDKDVVRGLLSDVDCDMGRKLHYISDIWQRVVNK